VQPLRLSARRALHAASRTTTPSTLRGRCARAASAAVAPIRGALARSATVTSSSSWPGRPRKAMVQIGG
jgi:hypothetical protein